MNDYFEIISRNVIDREKNRDAPFSITYTAMHGVGYPYIVEAFKVANFKVIFFICIKFVFKNRFCVFNFKVSYIYYCISTIIRNKKHFDTYFSGTYWC